MQGMIQAASTTDGSQVMPAGEPARESENEIHQKRIWRKISNKTRLMLEICVGYGLSVDFAGKTINMSSRNANRIMKEQARLRNN